MKTLLLDIETAPNTVYVWGLYDQDIAINQIVESSYVLCWSAKWLDRDEMLFERTWHKKRSTPAMIRRIHALLDEADQVVTYNGSRFDLPTLNREFILHGLNHPAPYAELDLLRVTRKKFKFLSNKLDYVSGELKLGHKTPHDGFMLWVKCMSLDKEAWEAMTAYNKNDVLLLEKLYYKLLPWMKLGTSYSVRNESNLACPNCGSTHYQQRGFAYSKVAKYARMQCQTCRSWFRTNVNELEKGRIKTVQL